VGTVSEAEPEINHKPQTSQPSKAKRWYYHTIQKRGRGIQSTVAEQHDIQSAIEEQEVIFS
jgi:hypothetical protein